MGVVGQWKGMEKRWGWLGSQGPVLGGPASPALCHRVGDGLTGEAGIELMCK